MLNLTRWSPLIEMHDFHREFDRALGAVWNRFPEEENGRWVPAAEVASDADGWCVRMALPGVDPKNVNVDLQGDSLLVSGERNVRQGLTSEQSLSEFGYGRFERRFTLPENVDLERIGATFEHGMLELTLPLAEVAKPRRIEIGTSPAVTVA